jgi:hypothetical protein
MFLHPDQSGVPFNDDGCPQDGALLPATTLDKHDFAWVYPGDGPITMGYMSPWVIRQFIKKVIFDEGTRPIATFEAVLHGFRDVLCEDDPDDREGPSSNVEPLKTRVKKFLKLIGLKRGQTVTLDDAMNWTRPMLKKIAMLADPPHDTMREEELEDELGFPVEWSQLDGTESGPSTRLAGDRWRLPGDTDGKGKVFEADFDRYLGRDHSHEERPLPLPVKRAGSRGGDAAANTPRAHLNDFYTPDGA